MYVGIDNHPTDHELFVTKNDLPSFQKTNLGRTIK